jgi:hypothetical protein
MKILREAGSGAIAASSTCASRAKNWSLAFMSLLEEKRMQTAEEERCGGLTLPSRRHYPDQVPRVFSHPPALTTREQDP